MPGTHTRKLVKLLDLARPSVDSTWHTSYTSYTPWSHRIKKFSFSAVCSTQIFSFGLALFCLLGLRAEIMQVFVILFLPSPQPWLCRVLPCQDVIHSSTQTLYIFFRELHRYTYVCIYIGIYADGFPWKTFRNLFYLVVW